MKSTTCECGCGRTTNRIKQTDTANGYKAGDHRKFIHGHNKASWKGGVTYSKKYIYQLCPSHPRTDNKGYVPQHYLVVEAILGKPLPLHALIHHVDGNGKNNNPDNLLVCESKGYHNLLHARQRALEACGHVHWKICTGCNRYDDASNMKELNTPRPLYYHTECNRIKGIEWRRKIKELER